MGIRGSFSRLSELSELLGKRGKLHDSVKRVLAEEAMTQVREGFRAARDPYGNAWKPLKYRRGRPLQKTARLRNSFVSKVTKTGFTFSSNVVYAAPHQDGGGDQKDRPPQRMMLPTKSRGLGPIWGEAFRKASGVAIKKFFRT